MDAAARTPFLLLLAGVGVLLVVATVVARVLLRRAGGGARAPVLANLDARIRAWWGIVALLGAAALAGVPGLVVLFGGAALAALRELLRHAPPALADRRLDAAAYGLVVLQSVLLLAADGRAALAALPVAAALALPLAALVAARPQGLQGRLAHRLWAVLVAGWCLAHVPALARLALPGGADAGLLLAVWLVVVAQSSDVLQYVFGKALGRRAIAPRLSPDKTVEGFGGGVACAAGVGAALAGLTPFAPWQAGAAALAVALLGFAGGLVLSGVKRDLGVKDWGAAIPGHGGVLDRVDSLLLSAPAFYYAVAAGWAR